MRKNILIIFLAIFSTLPAYAKSLPINPDAKLKIGLNATYNSLAYDVDNTIAVMPQAFYDNNRLYIEGSEAGVYAYKDKKHEWRATVGYEGRSFDPADATSNALKQLDKRKWSANIGTSYMYITPYGGFKAHIETDALNRNDGTTLKLSHLSKFTHEQWTIYPEFGVIWSDDNYNNYYYGISEQDNQKTGLTRHDMTDNVNPFFRVAINYAINQHWNIFFSQYLEYLTDEQKNSPLVNSSINSKSRIGFNYQF